MHLHNCRCFQEHLRMLLQSLREKRRNCDRTAMCNATRGIDAGRWVIRHRGVSDGSDWVRPLWRSHSARTEMFFPDEQRDGWWICEQYGGYERLWEIRGTTCQIGFRRPRLGVITAGSGLVPAVSGMVNWLTHKILLSPSFSWWFPPSPLISLFLVLNSTIT